MVSYFRGVKDECSRFLLWWIRQQNRWITGRLLQQLEFWKKPTLASHQKLWVSFCINSFFSIFKIVITRKWMSLQIKMLPSLQLTYLAPKSSGLLSNKGPPPTTSIDRLMALAKNEKGLRVDCESGFLIPIAICWMSLIMWTSVLQKSRNFSKICFAKSRHVSFSSRYIIKVVSNDPFEQCNAIRMR